MQSLLQLLNSTIKAQKQPVPTVVVVQSISRDSLQPHGLQHTRLLGPPLSPGAGSGSWPVNQWCHLTISSSDDPFSSCFQSFPASGSFLRSQFFESGGQNIGATASASVLPVNIQSWFPLGLTGLPETIHTQVSMAVFQWNFKNSHTNLAPGQKLANSLFIVFLVNVFLCITGKVVAPSLASREARP